MKRPIQLTRLDGALLAGNLVAFGACLTLLALKGATVPLVLLTVGAGLAAAAKLGRLYCRASNTGPASNRPVAEELPPAGESPKP